MRSSSFWLFVVLAALAVFTGCSKPEPPKVKAENATVKNIDASGLTIEVTLDVENVNSFPLSATSVKARVKVGDKIDLGEVTAPTKVSIGAKKHEKVVVPLELKWSDVAGVAMLAANNATIPYKVEGTAAIGTESVHFDVPFDITGTLTREQLMKVGAGALPVKLPIPLPIPLPQ